MVREELAAGMCRHAGGVKRRCADGGEARRWKTGCVVVRVAMVDALGFRGIWRRYKPDAILGRLRDLSATTGNAVRELREKAVPNPTNAIAFTR